MYLETDTANKRQVEGYDEDFEDEDRGDDGEEAAGEEDAGCGVGERSGDGVVGAGESGGGSWEGGRTRGGEGGTRAIRTSYPFMDFSVRRNRGGQKRGVSK